MMRVLVENFLRSRLALHGRRFKTASAAGGVRKQVESELTALLEEGGLDLRSDLEPLVDLAESLRNYLSKLDRDLNRRARADPVCRLLMEVPGVGPICALSFYSAIEDPTRFGATSDVGAYFGLTPRRHQSGAASQTRGITKAGSKMTRTHLVTSATIFGRSAPDGPLKDWFRKLRGRVGSKRAQVALARKLAIILLTMWKNNSHFQIVPARPAQEDLSRPDNAARPKASGDDGSTDLPSGPADPGLHAFAQAEDVLAMLPQDEQRETKQQWE